MELYDNFIQFGWPSAELHFYDVGRTFDRPQYKDKSSNLLYKTEYFLMNHQMDHERACYDIVQLLGDIGGVIEFVMVLSAMILSPYSEFIYLTKALKKLYLARTRDKHLFRVSRNSHQQKELKKDKILANREAEKENAILSPKSSSVEEPTIEEK